MAAGKKFPDGGMWQMPDKLDITGPTAAAPFFNFGIRTTCNFKNAARQTLRQLRYNLDSLAWVETAGITDYRSFFGVYDGLAA